jgi:hypothetical protein
MRGDVPRHAEGASQAEKSAALLPMTTWRF